MKNSLSKLSFNKLIKEQLPKLLLILLFFATVPAFAQNTSETTLIASSSLSVEITQPAFQVTEELVAQKLSEISENTQLSEPHRKRLEETWGKVKTNLGLYKEWEQKLNNLKRLSETSAQSAKELHKKLETNDRLYTGADYSKYTISELENLFLTEETSLKSTKSKAVELDIQIDSITTRRQEIPSLVSEVKKKMETITQEIQTQQPEENVEISQARNALRSIQHELLKIESSAYDYEISTFEVRLTLLKEQREYFLRISNDMEEYLTNLQNFLSEQKKLEAEKAAQKAQQKVENLAHSLPELKQLAEENASFTAKRGEILNAIDTAAKDYETGKKILDRLLADQRALKEKVRAMGFSDSMGLLFRIKRGELPDAALFREKIAKRQDYISKTQGNLLSFEDKASKMVDLKRFQKDTIDLIAKANQVATEVIDIPVREILKSRRGTIDDLIKEYRVLLGKLVDLDAMESRLLDTIRQFETFINENVFWIPSSSPIKFEDFSNAFSGLKSLLTFSFWYNVAADFIKSLFSNIWHSIFSILLLITILGLRPRAIILNREASESINKAGKDNFWLTIQSILLTFFITSFTPICIWLLGSLLADENTVSISSKRVGDAFLNILPISWLLFYLRGCFREKGLANMHFRWHLENVYELLRRQLLLLFLIPVPLYFFNSIAASSQHTSMNETLGKFIFLALVLTTAFIFHSITSPTGKVYCELEKYFKDKLICKLRYFLYFLSVIFPFSMGLFASIGYVFTAQQLYVRGIKSLVIATAAVFIYGLISRLLQVQRRNLAVLKYQEKLASSDDPSLVESPINLLTQPNDGISIYSLSKQANNIITSLLVIGMSIYLWNIWKDIIPAVKIFDQISLWSTDIRVEELVTGPDGAISKQIVEKVVTISLIDLIMSLIVLVLTFLGTRNLQGFLEFAILQRLPIDNGVRFAVTTLSKYLVTIVGTVWACQLIGISWEKVQWLVTGISVGLGFGLQEIFANFISGLIILFERPLRVGDYIVVGDHSGYVSEIRIRATTILTLDRRELVIPNKEFITGKIINWTLSERMFRLDFPVGVAYNSDIEKVQKVLLEVANSNSHVQKSPAPKAILTSFGDSSLNFELRVYIPSPENFPDFQNEINLAITKAFRKNEISIPFPQRDIHMIKEQPST